MFWFFILEVTFLFNVLIIVFSNRIEVSSFVKKFAINIVSIISITCFYGLFLSLGFLAEAFFFNNNISRGHLFKNFVLYSNLLIYSLLTVITYFIDRTLIQKYFVILILYSISISF